MGSGRELAFREAAGVLVLVHTSRRPSDAEWDEYLHAANRYVERATMPRILVLTDGGAPTPSQRLRMVAAIEKPAPKVKVAVLTGSTFVRGVVAAVHLFFPVYQAFTPTDLKGALRYLDSPPSSEDAIRQCLSSLMAELALDPPGSARRRSAEIV